MVCVDGNGIIKDNIPKVFEGPNNGEGLAVGESTLTLLSSERDWRKQLRDYVEPLKTV